MPKWKKQGWIYWTTELESYSEHQIEIQTIIFHTKHTHTYESTKVNLKTFFQRLEIIISYLATLDEKERTFDAFTKHTRELIEKEKFLNKRLRAYSLQMPAASSTSDNAVDKWDYSTMKKQISNFELPLYFTNP